MQRGVIVITQKEATRYDVLRRVLDGTISLVALVLAANAPYARSWNYHKDGPCAPPLLPQIPHHVGKAFPRSVANMHQTYTNTEEVP